MLPSWKKIMDGQGKGDKKGKGATKGSSKGSSVGRDQSGRFQPRHGTFMVNATTDQQENASPEQLWQQTQQTELPPVPDHQPSDYTFVDGQAERITFAWPNAAPVSFAREKIRNPEHMPQSWKTSWF